MEINHCVWTGTTNYSLYFYTPDVGSLTGTRSFTNNVFDNRVGSGNYTTSSGNTFLSSASMTAANYASGDLYYSPGYETDVLPNPTISNSYFLIEDPTGNPHFVGTNLATGTYTISGNIFHFNSNWSGDNGDTVLMYKNDATVIHMVVKNNLVLNGPDGYTAGTMTSFTGGSGIDCVADHNTFSIASPAGHGNVGIGMGETYAGYSGMYLSCRSNLGWRPTVLAGGSAAVFYQQNPSLVSKTITGCANNGSGLIRVTSASHGYSNGDWVTISGVLGTTEANSAGFHQWQVTNVTSNTFDLAGSAFVHTWSAAALKWRRRSSLMQCQRRIAITTPDGTPAAIKR